jgi:hypothetical protein
MQPKFWLFHYCVWKWQWFQRMNRIVIIMVDFIIIIEKSYIEFKIMKWKTSLDKNNNKIQSIYVFVYYIQHERGLINNDT